MATHLTPRLYCSTGPQHASVTQGHTCGPEWKWPRYTKTDQYTQTCYRVPPVGSRDCSGPKVLGQAPQVCQLTLYFLAWTGKCPTADKETSLGSHIRLGMGDVRRMLPCASPGCLSLHLPDTPRLRTATPSSVPTCQSLHPTTRPHSGSRESWHRLTLACLLDCQSSY